MPPDADLLVGLDTSDDAGVYRLSDDLALVQTVDFFTPVVDDPYVFGQIAAANALSDVYAMGGRPLTVLNLVGFPVSRLDKGILVEILRGGADKVREAGATIVGGHSIDDAEPKFGMAVTGIVSPKAMWTNAGARPDDVLILTKPVGVGIVTTAIKRQKATDDMIRRVQEVMVALNKTAAEVAAGFSVHACTDVTGFGLLGHAAEIARASGVGIRILADRVPVLPGTWELAEQGVVPGGTRNNEAWLADWVDYHPSVPPVLRTILCDAVTSGGLLLCVAKDRAEELVEALRKAGVADSAAIGEIIEGPAGRIEVL